MRFRGRTLVTDTSSITWEQRTRVARNLTLSYAYTFERNHTFDTTPALPDDPIGPFDITINIARLTAAAAWDTRDDPVDTTRGSLLSRRASSMRPRASGRTSASCASSCRRITSVRGGRWCSPRRRASASVSPLGGQD